MITSSLNTRIIELNSLTTVKLLGRCGLLGLLVAALTFVAPARAVVVNSDRAAVLAAFEAEFNRTEPASAWAGSQTACTPGLTTNDYQLSVLQRVNWYRAQAGLPPVAYASQNTAAAQAAALYQSRAKTLSHYISDGTPCYSSAASEGSMRSNLALGSSGVRAIDLYIVDPGANNTAVGHRQWILGRTLGDIATGDVEASDGYVAANALYVVGASVPAVTPRDGFVAWPSPGYFPDAVVPERWSFAPAETVNFSSAQVTLQGPSGIVPTTIVHNSSYLVFETKVSSSVKSDTTYSVVITGVSDGRTRTYDVTLVDANAAPRSTGSGLYGASTCAPVGATVASESFTDPDGDAVTVTLVSGEGDTDNSKFTVTPKGAVSIASELSIEQTSYQVRLRATDARGAIAEKKVTFSLTPARSATKPCSVRNVRATRNGQKIAVSWDHPVVGTGFNYVVFVNSSGGFCETTRTSCTVIAKNADSYLIQVYADSGSELSSPAEITLSGDGDGSSTSTTTSVQSGAKTLKRSKAYTITKVMKIPAGTRAFKTSGPCKMSSTKTSLLTTSKKGTCKVAVTTSRKVKGKTVKTTTRATFKVA